MRVTIESEYHLENVRDNWGFNDIISTLEQSSFKKFDEDLEIIYNGEVVYSSDSDKTELFAEICIADDPSACCDEDMPMPEPTSVEGYRTQEEYDKALAEDAARVTRFFGISPISTKEVLDMQLEDEILFKETIPTTIINNNE